MTSMFQNEQLLKQTPLFAWFFLIATTIAFISLQSWSPYQVRYQNFDLNITMTFGYLFRQGKTETFLEGLASFFSLERTGKLQLYRLFTSLLLPDPARVTYTSLLIDLVGLHCCTWFVIAATRSRW